MNRLKKLPFALGDYWRIQTMTDKERRAAARERYANDPEYRARVDAARAERAESKARAQAAVEKHLLELLPLYEAREAAEQAKAQAKAARKTASTKAEAQASRKAAREAAAYRKAYKAIKKLTGTVAFHPPEAP